MRVRIARAAGPRGVVRPAGGPASTASAGWLGSESPVSRAGGALRSTPATLPPEPRRGISVVEFAVIAPLLFLIVFGAIEFGRAFMVQQILTNASREGARRAIVESATAPEVEKLVQDYLAETTVSNATVQVEPATLDTLGFGDPVTVTVSVAYDDVSWLPSPWFLGGSTMTASTVMRAERLQ